MDASRFEDRQQAIAVVSAGHVATKLWILVVILWLTPALAHADEIVWRDRDSAGHDRIHLYFFWSATCPHCQEARPVVEELGARHEWLVVHSHELTRDPAAAQLYTDVAASLGEHAQYIPAFAYCETLVQGFPGATKLELDLLA